MKKGMGVLNKGRPLERSSKTKTTLKKTKRRRSLVIIRGIIQYLKSDSYLYSPLFSLSSPPRISSPGSETEEPLLKNDGNLREKVADYLKSDTYLYAPLGGTPPSDHFALKTIISPRKGPELQLKKSTDKVPSKEISSQRKKVAEESTGEKRGDRGSKGAPGDAIDVTPSTPELMEVKRRVIHRSYCTRLSTVSGNKPQE